MPASVTPLPRLARAEETSWGVIAWFGAERRVAEIFPSRARALADCAWREAEVRAYAQFLRNTGQVLPHYSIAPVRRSDLPRKWRPLPALGFVSAG